MPHCWQWWTNAFGRPGEHLIVADKQKHLQFVDIDEAIVIVQRHWYLDRASNDQGVAPML
jgi:hypothetical protein